MILQRFLLLLTMVAGVTLTSVTPAFANVQYVETMPPTQVSQIVYWFWHSHTLANAQYLNDSQNL